MEGLVLDWFGDNIYWVDVGVKKIELFRIDGCFCKSFIISNFDCFRVIVLDFKRGYMYWIDWGSSVRIERVYMFGVARVLIVLINL